jgi:hypothetical protein
MSGRAIELRAILDGPLRTARFDYRINAERFAFDRTGLRSGVDRRGGRLGGAPVLVPVRFRAARVTGVGDVAGGILRNLAVTGVLRVTSQQATGDGLQFTSDKLAGRASLVVDLRTGKFDVGLSGALGRFLIPGIGLVDVRSTLKVVPNPQGRGRGCWGAARRRCCGSITPSSVRSRAGFHGSRPDWSGRPTASSISAPGADRAVDPASRATAIAGGTAPSTSRAGERRRAMARFGSCWMGGSPGPRWTCASLC